MWSGRKGGELASAVHSYGKTGDPQMRALVQHILSLVSHPIINFLYRWIYDGELEDTYHEVNTHTPFVNLQDRAVWRNLIRVLVVISGTLLWDLTSISEGDWNEIGWQKQDSSMNEEQWEEYNGEPGDRCFSFTFLHPFCIIVFLSQEWTISQYKSLI